MYQSGDGDDTARRVIECEASRGKKLLAKVVSIP